MTKRLITIDTEAPFDLAEELKQILLRSGYMAILWHTDDVQMIRPDLSFEQSIDVLEQCAHHHDAEIGINWDVIGCHANDLFPEREAGTSLNALTTTID